MTLTCTNVTLYIHCLCCSLYHKITVPDVWLDG